MLLKKVYYLTCIIGKLYTLKYILLIFLKMYFHYKYKMTVTFNKHLMIIYYNCYQNNISKAFVLQNNIFI